MKRAVLCGVLLVLALVLALLLRSSDPDAPRFTKLSGPLVVQSSGHIGYDHLSPNPFDGGKVWIGVSYSRTNGEAFLYDLDHRKVLGELTGGWPVLSLASQSRVLCARPAPRSWRWKEAALKWVERVTGGRIKHPQRPRNPWRYWLVDIDKGFGTRLGDLPEAAVRTFCPSPDFRYAYTGMQAAGEFYCFDLWRRVIRRLNIHGWPLSWGWPEGWWDNRTLLVETTNRDFVLFDVSTERITPFRSASQVAEFFRKNQLSDDPAKARAVWFWNGRENPFFLTHRPQGDWGEESFLIKVEQPDGNLKLLSRQFKIEFSDHFDPTERFYLYGGHEDGKDTSGVFLRDLQSGSNRVLVASESSKEYSWPKFYRDSMIYFRSNAVWQIGLNGSNNVRLFPPP